MKIIIKTTNWEISEDLKKYIKEKLGKLEKYLFRVSKSKNFEIKAFVEIGKVTSHHQKGPFFRAECNLYLPKKILRAEEKRENLREAINEIKKELKREIQKYKEARRSQTKRRARFIKKFLRLSPLARFWRKGRTREEGR